MWRHIRGESWLQTEVGVCVCVFEAIGGDVKFAQTQGWCLNMLATNMAPVSLSSSLFSVTMYNLGSSPRLLTMSFHIMLLHTRRCSQQAVTQLLCLKVRPVFAINALGACVKVLWISLSENH